MTDESHRRLEEAIDKNRDLLIDIKDNIGEELNLLKLAHQKLKLTFYGTTVVLLILSGKPELISLIAGF